MEVSGSGVGARKVSKASPGNATKYTGKKDAKKFTNAKCSRGYLPIFYEFGNTWKSLNVFYGRRIISFIYVDNNYISSLD